MTRDPLGHIDSYGLWNYVAGDPVNFRDPSGMDKVNAIETVNMGAAQIKVTLPHKSVNPPTSPNTPLGTGDDSEQIDESGYWPAFKKRAEKSKKAVKESISNAVAHPLQTLVDALNPKKCAEDLNTLLIDLSRRARARARAKASGNEDELGDADAALIAGRGAFAASKPRSGKGGRNRKTKPLSDPKWGNPASKPTFGHTFLEHGSKLTSSQLINRARTLKHQVSAWTDDMAAAGFIAAVAKHGPGKHDVLLPAGIGGRAFLPNGKEVVPNMARIIVKPDGTVRTAFPFDSTNPN